MKKSLYLKLEKLNEETDQIHASLKGISEEKLSDNSYGWSIIQVMSHLNLAENGSLIYMGKKMQAGDKMKVHTFSNQVRLILSKYFMQSRLKWKAPKVVSNPKSDYRYVEIKETWAQTRENIKRYIDDYPDEFLNRQVMKHPIAGRLNLSGTIDSFIYHQRHHVHQIKRIRKKIGV